MSNVADAHERMILPPLLTLFCKTSSAYASHDCYLSDASATLAQLIGRCRGVQSVYGEKIVQVESESISVCLSAPNNSSTTELKAHIPACPSQVGQALKRSEHPLSFALLSVAPYLSSVSDSFGGASSLFSHPASQPLPPLRPSLYLFQRLSQP